MYKNKKKATYKILLEYLAYNFFHESQLCIRLTTNSPSLWKRPNERSFCSSHTGEVSCSVFLSCRSDCRLAQAQIHTSVYSFLEACVSAGCTSRSSERGGSDSGLLLAQYKRCHAASLYLQMFLNPLDWNGNGSICGFDAAVGQTSTDLINTRAFHVSNSLTFFASLSFRLDSCQGGQFCMTRLERWKPVLL